MPNGIVLDEEESRKRASDTVVKATPKKKAKSGGLGRFFSSFLGMFTDNHENEERDRNVKRVFEVSDDDEEETDDGSVQFLKEEKDILSVEVKARTVEKHAQIVYLNEDQRLQCGKETTDSPSVEVVDDEDTDTDNDIQEVPSSSKQEPHVEKTEEKADDDVIFEKSFEIQQDVEVIGEVAKKTRTPSDSEKARRLQNEIVFLDEKERKEVEDDEISIISDSAFNNLSPSVINPDDSASRSNTPNFPTTPSHGRNMRDYWRRTGAQKTGTVTRKIPKRIVQNGDVMSISRVTSSTSFKKSKENDRLSLSKYMQALVKAGVMDKSKISPTSIRPPTKSSLVIKRAQQRIREIKDSREGTPSFDRYYAGAQSPSSSSYMSDASNSENKLNEMMRNVNLLSKHRPKEREGYAETFDTAQVRQDVLNEELKVRELSRQTTREERQMAVRDKLAMRGIVVKEKKTKTEFVELPQNAFDLCESAWNKRLPETEEFSNEFSIKICRKDLETFSGLNWLNDEVINFYLQLVCQRSTANSSYPKTYAFNTFFYANITTKGYASVKRWTRKVDIFSFDVLLVPVHLKYHWCMSVIDLTQKKIDYYDSLGGKNQQCLKALKSYLMEESMDKKKEAFDFSGWSFNLLDDIPHQENGSDCGVFSCQFAEFASRRVAPSFTQQHMPYYRKRMVYEICTKTLMSSI